MRNFVKKQSGITLIALVVTIIVLIILAGVSIAMLVGENGIITQAQKADELTTQAQQKEAIELAVASVQAQGTLELDRTKLETALQSQLGDASYTLTENGDGSFLLQIAERSYYIDSTGEVITQENMIAIGTAEELKTFRDDVNSGNSYEGKYVYLTENITLDINEEWEPIGIYVESMSNPETKVFRGIFNGNGNQIDYMKLTTSAYEMHGLFGIVANGVVKNVGIGEHCNINIENETHIGSIAGWLSDNATVQNCYNLSNISGGEIYEVGGIVGGADGNSNINNCYNKGNISSQGLDTTNRSIGGIVGNLMSGNVKNCYNTGNIKAAARRRNCRKLYS